jgi:hypothetical protein
MADGYLKYGASIYLYNSRGPLENSTNPEEQEPELQPVAESASFRGFISCKG